MLLKPNSPASGSGSAGRNRSPHEIETFTLDLHILPLTLAGWADPPLLRATDGLTHHYRIVSNGTERILNSKEVGVANNPSD